MALEWLTQVFVSLFDTISLFWDEELSEIFQCLPDGLIIDIISRLPIDTLSRCQRECMELRALISSNYFIALHLSRARPVLLLHNFWDTSNPDKQLYVLDKTGVTYLCRQPGVKWGESPNDISVFSCQGVLLFRDLWWPKTTYHVLNPITHEEVIVRHTHQPGLLCALYYCQGLRLLYAQVRGSLCQYLVYIFKTQTWRKIRSSSSTNFNLLPCFYQGPAVLNGALHWIMHKDLENKGLPPSNSCANNGIIVFRIDEEQLYAKPHPGSSTVCNVEQEHQKMSLLVKENCLSFCRFLYSNDSALDIWILEDYENWVWNKRYNIQGFSHRGGIPRYLPIHIYYIHEDELIIHLWGEDYIYFYNLDHKTVVKEVKLPPRYRLLAFRASASYLTKSMLPIA